MFNKGDYVVNSNNGICRIDDIVELNTPNGKKEYYLLIPFNEQTAKIYIPLDSASKRIRYAMNKDQAIQLIESIKNINETYIENEKEREKIYKDAINSCNPQKLVGIIKNLYLRRLERTGCSNNCAKHSRIKYSILANSIFSYQIKNHGEKHFLRDFVLPF